MRHFLTVLMFATSSFGFSLTSWVPFGSDRVELCWDPVPGASQYELFVCGTFHGRYTFSNAVASHGIEHPRASNLAGREFMFIKALNAAHDVLATSDTVGCYYLERLDPSPSGLMVITFGLGGLEYRDVVGPAGCEYVDSVSTRPSDILGIQFARGAYANTDRIYRYDTGALAYRNWGSIWVGTLETSESMTLGRVYRYVSEAGDRPPILTGRATSDYAATVVIPVTAPVHPANLAITPVGFPIIDVTPISELGLVASGFVAGSMASSDRVAEMSGGRFAYLTDSGEWRGRLTECAPEASYWIVNRHYGPSWTYISSIIDVP